MKWKVTRNVCAWIAAVSGIASVLFLYLAMCFTTISSEYKVGVPLFITGVLAAIAYLCCIFICVKKQLIPIMHFLWANTLFIFVCIVVFISDYGRLSGDNRNSILLTVLIWCFTLLITGGFLVKSGNNLKKFKKGSLWKAISQYKYLSILLIILTILSIDYHGIQFKWDGLLYYQTCQSLEIHSLSNLAIYGHIAQTFGALIQICIILFRDVAFGMAFMNVLLLLCSSAAFYGTIKTIVPEKTDLVYTIGTAVYAFSPFLLGMVNYYSLDYYCLCFFTIVFFFACRRQWYPFLIVSLLFCFTKEPAVIAYGGLCIGILLSDFIKDEENSFGSKLVRILKNPRYYVMTIPGVLWLCTYLLLGPWSAGNGGFSVDFSYVIDKIKVLYILNFNWLFALILICGVVFVISNRNIHWKDCGWLIYLLCSLLCFTMFSCMFQTVNHPRYSDVGPVCLYITGVIFVLMIPAKLIRNAIGSILAVLMLVSSYYTLDPISRQVFPMIDIGNTTMVTPWENVPGDGIVYNKQSLYFERALNKALEDCVKQEEIVIFPAIEGSNYNFDGMAPLLTVSGGYRYCIEYWEEEKDRRSSEQKESAIPLRINYVIDLDGIDALKNETADAESIMSYFYLPCAGADIAEEIRRQYDIIEEKEYTSGGWRVGRIVFRCDYESSACNDS